MITKSIKFLCMFFCIIALGACAKDEESFTGNIIGKVTDSSTGEVMSGVTVTIVPSGKARTTGSDGYFEFRDLDPKQYEIQARKEGYTTNTKTVNVTIGADAQGDIQLTPVAQDGKLALNVSSLNFGTQNTSMSFSITNKGNVAFNWNISGHDKAGWISVSPISGTLQPGKSHAVTVNINRDHVTEYKEATIIINAGNESQPLKIIAEPESKTSLISLSSGTLNFGTDYSSLTFDIKNIGNAGNVDWSISGINESWVSVTPTSGTTAMGKSSAVIINVDRSKMTEGKHSTHILVNADGESLKLTINAEKGNNRYLEVTPSALVVGTSDAVALSVMSHNGSTAYRLSGVGDFGWALFDKTEGIIPEFNPADPNTIETVALTVDRTGLAAGTYSFTLVIQSDLGDYNVPVTMTVEETPNGGGNAGPAEIISCHDNLEFTLKSCKISGTTATIDMTVKNTGNSTINLNLAGSGWGSYAYDDMGNKYDSASSLGYVAVSLANNNYSSAGSSSEIPANVTTNASIKIYNVSDLSSLFNYISIYTNQEIALILKNVAIEGRGNVALESPKTSGEIITCNDDLEFTLLDCKRGANYTTISFRVKNNGFKTIALNLAGSGWGSYAYDDMGNKYDSASSLGYVAVSLANNNYSSAGSSSEIPAGIFTNGSIRISNVDPDATEFANITIDTNQDSNLILKNVKIRN